MIKKIVILFVMIILPNFAFAAFETEAVSARLMGMGNAFVAVSDDANAVFANPSGLDFQYGMSMSGGYTKLFGLDELTKSQVSYGIATNLGGFGLDFSNFGDDLYGERTTGISYGKKIMEKFALGTSLKWHQIEIQDYGSKSAFSIDVGLLAVVTSDFRVGAFGKSLNRPNLTEDDSDRIEHSLTIGASYVFLDKLIFAVDIYKEPNFEKEYKMGLEYTPIPLLSLRCGAQTNPSRYSFGASVNYFLMNFDYAYVHHTILEGTHYFSVRMNWGAKIE